MVSIFVEGLCLKIQIHSAYSCHGNGTDSFTKPTHNNKLSSNFKHELCIKKFRIPLVMMTCNLRDLFDPGNTGNLGGAMCQLCQDLRSYLQECLPSHKWSLIVAWHYNYVYKLFSMEKLLLYGATFRSRCFLARILLLLNVAVFAKFSHSI